MKLIDNLESLQKNILKLCYYKFILIFSVLRFKQICKVNVKFNFKKSKVLYELISLLMSQKSKLIDHDHGIKLLKEI